LQVSIGVLLVVLFAHQLASYVHVYVNALPTVSEDSSGFNAAGRMFFEQTFSVSGMFYVQLLAHVYQFFGYSQFLGCQLSQLAFALSLILLIETALMLRLETSVVNWCILTFALLPSCWLTTAVTMREAFQMTGFLLICYGLLRLRVKGVDHLCVVIPIGALWLLVFHNGFAVFLLFAVPLGLSWATGAKFDRFLLALAGGFVLLFLFGENLWGLMLERSISLHRILDGEGLEYIDQYADQVFEGRTDFDVNLKLDSVGSFLQTGPIVYAYYLFSPLPWQIRAALDFEGVFESCVRMYLFYFSVKGVFRARGEARSVQAFLLILFLLMELTWAAGTANWGTAIRHRLVAWPLLVLLGMKGRNLVNLVAENKEAVKPRSRRRQIREIREKQRLKQKGNEQDEKTSR
jgi:hypothetical protein